MPIALGIIGMGLLAFALVKMSSGSSAGAATPSTSSTSTAPPSSSSSVTLTGNGAQTAGQLVNDLMGTGLTRTAAAGIVGNLQQESSLNAAEPGGGLAQWIGGRWTDLVNFAAHEGLSPDSERAQLDFLTSDLNSSYSSLKAQINAATTPEAAAVTFEQVYERAGTPMNQNRTAYARQAYNASLGN